MKLNAWSVAVLLFLQPGDGADLGAPAEGPVVSGHIQWRGVTDKHLARKIDAQAAVFQTPIRDAALKDGAFAFAGFPKLVATATADAILVGGAQLAIPSTDGGQPAPHAFTVTHAISSSL
jgi:hypothetical protein